MDTWKIFVVLLLIGAICGPLLAEAQLTPQEKATAKQALVGIAPYPPEIRTAILEVCQKPELITEMATTGKLPDLKAYPESIQNAAKEMMQHLDIIKLLNEHIEITKVVGRLYAESSPEAAQVIDKFIAEFEKEDDARKEEWLKILKEDPNALQEFRDALLALKKAKAAAPADKSAAPDKEQPAPDDTTAQAPAPDTSNQADVDDDGDDVTLYSAPDDEMVDYLVANADYYPGVAAWTLWYWHHWHHRWPYWPPWRPMPLHKPDGHAQKALDDLHGLAGPADIRKNPELLREVAKLRKRFPNAKGPLTEHKERIQHVASRPNEYPNLAKHVEGFGARNPAHPSHEWRKSAPPSREPVVKPRERPEPTRPEGPVSIHRGEPDERQMISTGLYHHANCWRGISRGGAGQVILRR